MTDRLTFNADAHEYFWDGKAVPGVTDILESVNISDFSMVKNRHLDYGMERGSAVHLACAFFDENDLDWDTVPEEAEPYVRAWEKFTIDTGFEPIIIEKMGYSEKWGYAGTVDVCGILNSRKVLIDRKSNSVPKSTQIQLSAYEHLVEEQGPFVERYGIALRGDGTYKLSDPYLSVNDFAVFTCALAVYRWKKEK